MMMRDTAMQLGVLKLGIDVNKVDSDQESIRPFPKFKDIMAEIPIDPLVKPVTQPYRRIPIPMEEQINRKIKELLDSVSCQCH